MSRKLRYCIVLALTGLSAAAAQAQVADQTANLRAMQSMSAAMKGGAGQKLGTQLMMMQRMVSKRGVAARASDPVMAKLMSDMRVSAEGYVPVEAFAIGNAEALRADLVSRGMIEARVLGRVVAGRVPVTALGDMANSTFLRSMRPVMYRNRVGLTTSQADQSLRTAQARAQFGVDGRGIRVGVLSDSFDCSSPIPGIPFTSAADDVRNNDLSTVQVIRDLPRGSDCTDEGRAMLQLVHDLAPGAPLSFHTASEGEAAFANGIIALANAGAKVIVDDIGYFTSPYFQDGVVSQAVDTVVRRGVSYFSAAGNDGRNSYASAFRNSGGLHDFDASSVTDTRQSFSVTLPAQGFARLGFQWDQPFFSVSGGSGTRSDVDIFFVNAQGTPIVSCDAATTQSVCQVPGIDSNIGMDAFEFPVLVNLTNRTLAVTNLSISIQLFSGVAPGRMQYISFDGLRPTQFDTRSPTVYGHPNSAGAEAVAAAAYFDTAASGSTQCSPACVEPFSSLAGIPIFFNTAGARLATPVTRFKPGLTAADGTNTTFFGGDAEGDGFPNFFGTSAAAPHAAAVAALMYDRRARSIAAGTSTVALTPAAVVQGLRNTALDIRQERLDNGGIATLPTGADTKTGAGLINAVGAVQSAQ